MKNNSVTYNSWDLTLPKLPDQSRLYSLEPIGIGTPYVESLTSYIIRLSFHHRVPPKKLILTEVGRQMKGDGYMNRLKKPILSDILGDTAHKPTMNGMGLTTHEVVQAIEQLTLRQDICHMTFVAWYKIINSKDLFNSYLTWCPDCYNEWQQNGKTLYEPLIWSFKIVKFCLLHKRKLFQRCQFCNRSSLISHEQVVIGYCQRCKEWLGNLADNKRLHKTRLTKEQFNYQKYILRNLEELIAVTPYLNSYLNFEKIIEICNYFSLTKTFTGRSNSAIKNILDNFIIYKKLVFNDNTKEFNPLNIEELCLTCYENQISFLDVLLNL